MPFEKEDRYCYKHTSSIISFMKTINHGFVFFCLFRFSRCATSLNIGQSNFQEDNGSCSFSSVTIIRIKLTKIIKNIEKMWRFMSCHKIKGSP